MNFAGDHMNLIGFLCGLLIGIVALLGGAAIDAKRDRRS